MYANLVLVSSLCCPPPLYHPYCVLLCAGVGTALGARPARTINDFHLVRLHRFRLCDWGPEAVHAYASPTAQAAAGGKRKGQSIVTRLYRGHYHRWVLELRPFRLNSPLAFDESRGHGVVVQPHFSSP